jgi:hypothetical protein
MVKKEASRKNKDLTGCVLLADTHLTRLELVGQYERFFGMGPQDAGRGQRRDCDSANEGASGNHAYS